MTTMAEPATTDLIQLDGFHALLPALAGSLDIRDVFQHMPTGRLDERGPRRNVTVQRSDPRMRSTCDVLEWHVGRLREGLDRRGR